MGKAKGKKGVKYKSTVNINKVVQYAHYDERVIQVGGDQTHSYIEHKFFWLKEVKSLGVEK